jgi:lipopolysaccharide exporter
MSDAGSNLRAKVARGAAWSSVSTITLRLGSVVVGIVLARLLTPSEFGVYAVALTVQSILMTVADLGLSASLVRSDEPERIAPTVATLGLAIGATTTAITVATSSLLADLLGSPPAAPAISVLALTLLLSSVSLVPYSMLLRRFQQRELFIVGVADFVVSTAVTLALVALGFSVMGLAIGRVAAQVVSSALQFFLARVRPRFRIDRDVVRPVLGFGLPIALANLLAWGLINIDNIVLVRVAGATALGFYVLAFNISNWPMSALSQTVRAVSLPYFSRTGNADEGLARFVGLGWAAALPAGGLLAMLSAPLVFTLYGQRWLPAAPVLAALGVFGALRVIFDIFNAYLFALGHSRPVLVVQLLWLVTLTVGMVFATRAFGILGAGWVHVIVALVVVLPAYLVILRRAGVGLLVVLKRAWWPSVATLPAAGAVVLTQSLVSGPVLRLLIGGAVASAVYLVVMWPWARREWRKVRRQTTPAE